MTLARGLAAAALALAVVFVVLLIAGGNKHEYTLVFQSAGQPPLRAWPVSALSMMSSLGATPAHSQLNRARSTASPWATT